MIGKKELPKPDIEKTLGPLPKYEPAVQQPTQKQNEQHNDISNDVLLQGLRELAQVVEQSHQILLSEIQDMRVKLQMIKLLKEEKKSKKK